MNQVFNNVKELIQSCADELRVPKFTMVELSQPDPTKPFIQRLVTLSTGFDGIEAANLARMFSERVRGVDQYNRFTLLLRCYSARNWEVTLIYRP